MPMIAPRARTIGEAESLAALAVAMSARLLVVRVAGEADYGQ